MYLENSKTIIIKIGSSLIIDDKKIIRKKWLLEFAKDIKALRKKNKNIIIVSSGAIALGCKKLNITKKKLKIDQSQAVASVGQIELMNLFKEIFAIQKINISQILLTLEDTEIRRRAINAKRTIENLFNLNFIPIVNENDTIANEELKYGDNDTLSALVALAINAKKLILLTDINNLYSKDPKENIDATPIREVHDDIQLNEIKSSNINSNNLGDLKRGWGTGGITTKLIAAEIATKGGVTVQLADGRDNQNLKKIFNNEKIGTIFYPCDKPIGNKKSWLSHAIQSVGDIIVDDGACFAIQNKGASLLLVGIINTIGNFSANQPIRILNKDEKQVAKGITSMSSDSINSILHNKIKKSSSQIVVHRDVLVLS